MIRERMPAPHSSGVFPVCRPPASDPYPLRRLTCGSKYGHGSRLARDQLGSLTACAASKRGSAKPPQHLCGLLDLQPHDHEVHAYVLELRLFEDFDEVMVAQAVTLLRAHELVKEPEVLMIDIQRVEGLAYLFVLFIAPDHLVQRDGAALVCVHLLEGILKLLAERNLFPSLLLDAGAVVPVPKSCGIVYDCGKDEVDDT
mmetsp:Transcript_25066/g.63297  ORF Transcript_25066/g.63297 Transcript_25066/m.63297 type:complete len:200 (+) Transcript_25066:212-811(+)